MCGERSPGRNSQGVKQIDQLAVKADKSFERTMQLDGGEAFCVWIRRGVG